MSNEYVIGFYNVENLFDTENDPYTEDDDFTPEGELEWDDKRYGRKLRNLSRVILSLRDGKPAVMGLAEVENEQVLLDLQEELNWQGLGMDFIHEESPDERGIDVALLYDPEQFRYTDHEIHPVVLEDPSDITRDILHVWGEIDLQEIHFFVNHWPSRGEGVEVSRPKRKTAAQVLRGAVDVLLQENPNARICIMGDLNDYPEDEAVQEVLMAQAKPTYARGELLNLSFNPHFRGEGSHNHRGDWGMLDHLIVSEALVTPQEGIHIARNEVDILDEEWLLYRNSKGQAKPNRTYSGPKYHGGYSDHLPISIVLTP